MLTLDKDVAGLSFVDRLDGLERIIPRWLVEQVITQTGVGRRFCKRLPAVLLVHFVLGLGLFCRDCYCQVFRWLHRFTPAGVPGRSTLCEARKRLGVRPLRLLADRVVRLLAELNTPCAFYHGLRLMALDGFTVNIPDTPPNERAFGRPGANRGQSAFPQARVVALCEAGTHVIWKWRIKPFRHAEQTMADTLLKFLTPQMLLMWDSNFLSYDRVKAATATGAQLLIRVSNWPLFQPIRRLSDGSFLAKFYRTPLDRKHDREGIVVRIIEYTFDDPHRPGHGHKHRLLTTLLDERVCPALELIELYHDRWEEELCIDEIKTHQGERAVLRSQTPLGVVQEIHSLLLNHFVVRTLMFQAAAAQQVAPRQMSFTATIKVLRCRIPECLPGSRTRRRWYDKLLSEMAEQRLPPRRNRINPRVIKRKYAKWKVKRPHHRHPPQPTKTFRQSIVMLD
jgi:hypothetical protein